MCNQYHPLSTNTPGLGGQSFTRRQFLGQLGMISAAASVPAFVSASASGLVDTDWYTASRPGVDEGRVLVVVQLAGGNDGLNSVIPFGQADYYRNRPQIAVDENDILKFEMPGGDGLGMHPNLAPIKEMIDAGRAAVINGVGYPNPNRSHFKSMDIWQSARTEEHQMRGRGWVGQAMDAAYPQDNNGNAPTNASLACVSIGNDAPMAVQGAHVKPVSFQSPELFRWTARDLGGPLSEAYDQLHQGPAPGDNDMLSFIHRTSCDAQVASDRVRQAVRGASDTRFPQGGLSQQLEQVAKMIRAELPTRVYYVVMGGFDTHAQQGNRHPALMQQFAQAMSAFYNELESTGHGDRVVSLAFSEFGRRLRQNASGGTDHGVAGPSFVFGSPVNAGLHGRYPSLTELDQGDLIHSVDFRSVYADILDNWMQIDSAPALGRQFGHLGLFASA